MRLEKLVRGAMAAGKAIRSLSQRASVFPRETILLTESDDSLRRLLAERLRLARYRTIEAADGAEAVRIVTRKQSGSIDLLLTDVVLPDLIGWDLGQILRLDYPKLKVLCLGRSLHDSWSRPRNMSAGFLILPVPFSIEPVLQAVRGALLDRTRSNSATKLVRQAGFKTSSALTRHG